MVVYRVAYVRCFSFTFPLVMRGALAVFSALWHTIVLPTYSAIGVAKVLASQMACVEFGAVIISETNCRGGRVLPNAAAGLLRRGEPAGLSHMPMGTFVVHDPSHVAGELYLKHVFLQVSASWW